jgi:hypothetical protein
MGGVVTSSSLGPLLCTNAVQASEKMPFLSNLEDNGSQGVTLLGLRMAAESFL